MHLQVHLDIDETAEQANYFEASARIRGVSRTELIARVIHKLLADQLILAVLDDNSARVEKRKRCYTRKVPGRANKRYRKADYAGSEKHGGNNGTF